MPELPEVETTTRGLQNRAHKVLCARFLDVWTDSPKLVKKPKSFEEFRKQILGKKIKNVWRRAKNIIFDLSDGYSLLVHQKLTGHLLIGKWKFEDAGWKPLIKGPLEDPTNRFLHLIFWLNNGEMLALSDLRKFAKVELWKTKELLNSKEFKKLGPEPLDKNFTFEKFKEVLAGKKGKIKQVLMNQEIIAGIGNIYSDEILWEAKIHPFRETSKLNESELKKIYLATKKILKKAVKLRGTSISDFRDPEGKEGFYNRIRKVYQREGEKCPCCSTKIKRLKINGRSAHFCPSCQKL